MSQVCQQTMNHKGRKLMLTCTSSSSIRASSTIRRALRQSTGGIFSRSTLSHRGLQYTKDQYKEGEKRHTWQGRQPRSWSHTCWGCPGGQKSPSAVHAALTVVSGLLASVNAFVCICSSSGRGEVLYQPGTFWLAETAAENDCLCEKRQLPRSLCSSRPPQSSALAPALCPASPRDPRTTPVHKLTSQADCCSLAELSHSPS